MRETHYTAFIKVERVEKNLAVTKEYNQTSKRQEEITTVNNRAVIAIAQMSISAASLESLADKIGAHMDLLEDGEM